VEGVLTDGGTLAIPPNRHSKRFGRGANKALEKLRERLRKAKVGKKYAAQLDEDDDSASLASFNARTAVSSRMAAQ